MKTFDVLYSIYIKAGIALLEGKVIVVTGGAKGIGPGCAQVMAGEGATVVIADNDEQAGPEVDLRRMVPTPCS